MDLRLQRFGKVICDPLPTEALKCKSLMRKSLLIKRENEGNHFLENLGPIPQGRIRASRDGSEALGVDLRLQGWI